MIGVAGQDGGGAIELLGQHDAGETMRQRDGAERQHRVRRLAYSRSQTVGAADKDGHRPAATVAGLAHEMCKALAGQRLAALVEGDDRIGAARELQERGAFLLGAL